MLFQAKAALRNVAKTAQANPQSMGTFLHCISKVAKHHPQAAEPFVEDILYFLPKVNQLEF